MKIPSASYTNPPNIIVPIVYYGVDCHASDVAGLPAKVKETTYGLNKWFKQIGIWFEASHVTLPCKGVSGTHDMTNPSASQITSFQGSEVIPLSTRKFRVLISRKASDVRYAGFFGLSTKYGYFHYGSMTIPLVAPHELGHGFGLRQFVSKKNGFRFSNQFFSIVLFIEQQVQFLIVIVLKMIIQLMILLISKVIIVEIHQVVHKFNHKL